MSGMAGRIEVLRDAQALAHRVAQWMTQTANSAQGRLGISLAGGSTPRRLYALLASDEFRARFPWQRVVWYWGDERFVPHDHRSSNFRMAREALLDRVPVPSANIRPIPVEGSIESAAARYARTLQQDYGATELDPARPLFDITLLGLGADGHTASLLPGQPVLAERARWVAAVPHGRDEARITMTYPALESSRHVAFLVSGGKKAQVVDALRAGRDDLPAARVRPVGELLWFLDRSAAGSDRTDGSVRSSSSPLRDARR